MFYQEIYDNILLIYYSNKIDIEDKLILFFLFIAHWVAVIFVSSYYFIEGTKNDYFVIAYLIFFIITWFYIYNDCMFSYYEKQILFDNNVFDFDVKYMCNPSISLFMKINLFTILLFIVVILFTLNAFYTAMTNLNISKMIVNPIISVFFVFMMYYRWQDYKIWQFGEGDCVAERLLPENFG